MPINEIDIPFRDECSSKLLSIINEIITNIEEEGVSSDPNDASAYYLLDRLTNEDEIVREFIENWQDYNPDDFPNGGNHRLYYLKKLHEKYTDDPLSTIVRENGILEKFRQQQFQTGRLRVDGSLLHGLGFRGLVAIAPESDVAQDAIENIRYRYHSQSNSVDDRIMDTSALGLLEHDYERFKTIVNNTTERIINNVNGIKGPDSPIDISATEILLVEKNPEFNINNAQEMALELYDDIIEDSATRFSLGYDSEVGIALLATGHGPSKSAYQTAWEKELQNQEKGKQVNFVSTQPATAVENRRTGIKDQMEEMISLTDESLYISTRGIGMLHHDLLDILESNPEIDLRILTNRKKAKGDRKKFKRAAMKELVERTEGGVKESALLHARMIISDEQRLLVSNADLTRDQLHDSFNAGIYTEDQESVLQAKEMFLNAWESADHSS